MLDQLGSIPRTVKTLIILYFFGQISHGYKPGLKEVENMLLLAEGTEYCRLRCRIRDLSVTIFENKNMCLG